MSVSSTCQLIEFTMSERKQKVWAVIMWNDISLTWHEFTETKRFSSTFTRETCLWVGEFGRAAQNPDLHTVQHLLDKLERWLWARPHHPTSVADLTNALLAEWEQIPAASLQILVESCPRILQTVREADLCPWVLDKMIAYLHVTVSCGWLSEDTQRHFCGCFFLRSIYHPKALLSSTSM